MGDKTPKRQTSAANGNYSPVNLRESPAAASPQKNLTGLPRVVRDLVADVYNNIQRWNDLHIKGAAIVKRIAAIKAANPDDFSDNLEKQIDELYAIVQSLQLYKDNLIIFITQIRASEKLQKNSEPLFISLDVRSLVNLVEDIAKAYEAEFELKKQVLQNIAHSKTKDEAMFLAALWTYQTKIDTQIGLKLEILLLETGHRKIS